MIRCIHACPGCNAGINHVGIIARNDDASSHILVKRTPLTLIYAHGLTDPPIYTKE